MLARVLQKIARVGLGKTPTGRVLTRPIPRFEALRNILNNLYILEGVAILSNTKTNRLRITLVSIKNTLLVPKQNNYMLEPDSKKKLYNLVI